MGFEQPLNSAPRRRSSRTAQGLRARQIWVPDTRTPDFKAKVAATCRNIVARETASDDIAFAQSIQYWPPGD